MGAASSVISAKGSGERVNDEMMDNEQDPHQQLLPEEVDNESSNKLLSADNKENVISSGDFNDIKSMTDKPHELTSEGGNNDDTLIDYHNKNHMSNNVNNNHKEDEELARKLAQELADAELAEKIAYEMMDEEYALKLSVENDGTYASTLPGAQPFVNRKIQQSNDEIYARKINDLFELAERDSDIFQNEIESIRNLSLKAEHNSMIYRDSKHSLAEARTIFKQSSMNMKSNENACQKSENFVDACDSKDSSCSSSICLNDHQKEFFRNYGFVVIPNVIPKNIVLAAQKSAHAMLTTDSEKENPLDREPKSFANLPERHRRDWINCQDNDLRALFSNNRNMSLCQSILGEFDFSKHNGEGKYIFAPRFRGWDVHPPMSKLSKKSLSHNFRRACPSFSYDLNNLPVDFDSWSRQFLISAECLDMTFAPCEFENWHIDNWDVMSIAGFDLIWGAFFSPLERGNLGNLIVYPGSHHKISQLLCNDGARNSVWYDCRKGEDPLPNLPPLYSAGVSDGRSYEVLAKEGDVILMHPFLAHGEGTNVSRDPRLAVFCRLQSDNHLENREKMHIDGDLFAPRIWTGDIFSLQVGV